ncbi:MULTISPECIES: formate dehydrogenase subunit beta [Stutzerimonas stutzeri subgroup]|jgi:formate dehydrogenase iron-sulfur subunit|uniref:Formate dehydrogenase iron-sulfur subunit n=4 Tax=Pseudomonadaceae TaxID=135621 RepID=A0AA42PA01_STUST|nr:MULTISPECIES: formate dehydrogenase subunit beta [Stutzerimonas stutzeri subgroup]MBW8452934.1 formate dehydrogenase subunit beta [Pseudomonas sp.]MCJ0879362.1 formate dehydrogenase subunit beta [Pseudomonas sp. JI-2]OHC21952.1 MAG: formate dehydrogenase subunit beta [Pseudomonadales bacterium RIFCSPHIGHO2_01_FULL_64_12]MBA1226435.1 formate dehydrogenase subunit beta [Stutzerimonas stutzeri]MBA1304610.1 formate dehydrogenase subunit beta [Stutzerimonas stutzeri]
MRGDQINLQNIIARSATTEPSPQIRSGGVEKVTKLIDVSVCIGCKACQVACMEWNDLRDEVGECDGTYNAPQDLTPSSFEVMRFSEYENEEGDLEWLIRKDNCMHCAEPGCLKACPSPGAIVQYANGIVDFNSEHCIGCGYCVAGCPFNIPRISKKDNKAYKCTLCSDRVYHGLEPACVKSCPTGSIQFGTKEQMLDYGAHRVEKLKERGFENAGIYDPAGVGGTHVVYVLQHADKPEIYSGLPKDPHISPTVELWKGVTKPIMSAVLGVSVLAGFFHYMTKGPKEEPEDDPEAEKAAADREQDLRDEERRP